MATAVTVASTAVAAQSSPGEEAADGLLLVALPAPRGPEAAQPRVQYAWCEDEDGFLEVEAPAALGMPRATIAEGAGGAALLHLRFEDVRESKAGSRQGVSAPRAWLPVPLCFNVPAGRRLAVGPGLRSAEEEGAAVWEVQMRSSEATPSLPSRAFAAAGAEKILHAQAAQLVGECQRRGWGVVDGFLRGTEADAVHLDVRRWWARGALRDGQIGAGQAVRFTRSDVVGWLDEAAAGCKISDPASLPPAFRLAQQRVDYLVAALSEQLRDLGGMVECQAPQLAVYPGNGTRYARHFDEGGGIKGRFSGVPQAVQSLFGERPRRRCTLILYLNPFWCEGQGGELRLFPEKGSPVLDDPSGLWKAKAGGERPAGATCAKQSRDEEERARVYGVDVAPLHGRLLAFLCDNENAHEVMPVWCPRLAVTWWLCEPRRGAAGAPAPEGEPSR